MEIRISSRQTFLFKYLLGPSGLIISCALVFIILKESSGANKTLGLVLACALFLLTGVFFYLCHQIKNIRVKYNRLYISDLKNETNTPLKNIVEVRDKYRWQ